MISQIHGVLVAIGGGVALIHLGEPTAVAGASSGATSVSSGATSGGPAGLTYEVLVSSYTAARLGDLLGQPITLYTLHYLEGEGQGSSFLPRLAGFLTPQDREFFDLFTSAKGIGRRKALRAMALSTDQIAAAIADRDLALLQSLPEIGRRTAETVVATLHGKVDRYVSAAAFAPAGAPGSGGGAPAPANGSARALAREALEVLMQLGENRAQALAWIDEVLRDSDGQGKPADVQDLIGRVYRLKAR